MATAPTMPQQPAPVHFPVRKPHKSQVLALLFLGIIALAGPAGAETESDRDAREQAELEQGEIVPPKSQEDLMVVKPMLDYLYSGAVPAKGADFSLNGVVPFQKLEGGYLVQPSPYFVDSLDAATTVAFLKTNETLEEGRLIPGRAVATGLYKYQSINGFTRNVLAFKKVKQ